MDVHFGIVAHFGVVQFFVSEYNAKSTCVNCSEELILSFGKNAQSFGQYLGELI
jgi:hypothetical protein